MIAQSGQSVPRVDVHMCQVPPTTPFSAQILSFNTEHGSFRDVTLLFFHKSDEIMFLFQM